MAFFDRVKEAGIKGLDKAKDLGEQAKLNVQKEKIQIRIKDTYCEIGKAMAEKYPELLQQYFAEEAAAIAQAKEEIVKLEEQLAALKAE
ncbi:MAG: hypothetical protein II617_02175 [Firmicutes bacterium]|nr:hypothetical protein [Bacillota bacterium]